MSLEDDELEKLTRLNQLDLERTLLEQELEGVKEKVQAIPMTGVEWLAPDFKAPLPGPTHEERIKILRQIEPEEMERVFPSSESESESESEPPAPAATPASSADVPADPPQSTIEQPKKENQKEMSPANQQPKKKKRKLSKEARAKIAEAQNKRWAAFRAGQPSPLAGNGAQTPAKPAKKKKGKPGRPKKNRSVEDMMGALPPAGLIGSNMPNVQQGTGSGNSHQSALTSIYNLMMETHSESLEFTMSSGRRMRVILTA